MSLDVQKPTDVHADGDVLELTHPEPADQPAPQPAAEPEEDARVAPEIGDGPAILFDQEEADREARAKKKREQAQLPPPFEIEPLESVFDHYKQKFGEEEAAKAQAYIEALQTASANKFIVPKRGENSLDQACDDIAAMLTKTPILQADANGVHLQGATAGSTLFYSAKGVQYNGPKKSFTAEDAELLALHAAKRADLMPPSKVWLTGTTAEKKLIEDAIAKVNLTLPPEAQIVVGRTAGPSLLDNIVGRFRKNAGTTPEGAPVAPALDETPAHNDSVDPKKFSEIEDHIQKIDSHSFTTERKIAQTEDGDPVYASYIHPENLGMTENTPYVRFTDPANGPRQIISIDSRGSSYPDYMSEKIKLSQDPDVIKDVQYGRFEEIANRLSDHEISKYSEIVATTEDGTPVHKDNLHLTETPGDTEILFTNPADGRRREIVSIQPTEYHAGFRSSHTLYPPKAPETPKQEEDFVIPPAPVSELGKGWGSASAGTANVSALEDDAAFIGPRAPKGWTPPGQTGP